MIILIIAACVTTNSKIIYASLMITIIPALFFVVKIQYWYKDHEGNFAGMLIMSGVMSIIILGEIIKSYIKPSLRDKYGFIVSITMIFGSFVGIVMTLFYGAKVYALALCIFIILYVLPRKFICNKYIYGLVCLGAVYGSIPIYILSNGLHEGLFGIKSIINIPVFAVFSILLLISIMRYRNHIENSFVSKLSYNAIIVCLITACFDKYILTVPFCLYYFVYAVCCNCGINAEYIPFDIKEYKNEIKADWLKKAILSCIVILPIVISIFILGPLEIYQANRYAFKFQYEQFIGWFILIAIIICIITGIVIPCITKNTYRFIISILFTLSVLSYIQYMFMNVKLISDDGGPLDFESLNEYTKTNISIWVILGLLSIALLYTVKDNWNVIVKGISAFLIIIQSVAILSIIVGLISTSGPRYYQFTGENQYKVGSEKNIILIILDTYSRGDLDRVLSKYPDALDGLSDFTYYTNTSSEYTSTFPSIPHMLTGYDCPDNIGYDTEIEKIEWLEEAWNTDDCIEFYKDLHELGYTINVHTGDSCDIFGAYDDIKDCIDNIEPSSGLVDEKGVLYLLSKMSIYRYVPYIIKPYFEVLTFDFDPLLTYDTVNSQELDSDIYDSLIQNGLKTDNIENLIKIQHSRGMHRPFSYNENCEYLPNSDGNVEDCGKGLLIYVDEYLNCLK